MRRTSPSSPRPGSLRQSILSGYGRILHAHGARLTRLHNERSAMRGHGADVVRAQDHVVQAGHRLVRLANARFGTAMWNRRRSDLDVWMKTLQRSMPARSG